MSHMEGPAVFSFKDPFNRQGLVTAVTKRLEKIPVALGNVNTGFCLGSHTLTPHQRQWSCFLLTTLSGAFTSAHYPRVEQAVAGTHTAHIPFSLHPLPIGMSESADDFAPVKM